MAMTPALVSALIELLRGNAAHKIFPDWLGVVVLAMLALFPLTLAYVIVVQRAMDVRMVLRQGLQYALAKTGLRALQMAVSTLVIAVIVYLTGKTNHNWKLTAPALGIIGFFAIRRIRWVGAKLRFCLPPPFFPHPYNSEQLLTK